MTLDLIYTSPSAIFGIDTYIFNSQVNVFLEKLSKFQQIKTRSRTEIPEKGNIGNAPRKFSRP